MNGLGKSMGLPRGEETLFTPDEPDDPTRVMGWKRAGEVVGDGLSSASGWVLILGRGRQGLTGRIFEKITHSPCIGQRAIKIVAAALGSCVSSSCCKWAKPTSIIW